MLRMVFMCACIGVHVVLGKKMTLPYSNKGCLFENGIGHNMVTK